MRLGQQPQTENGNQQVPGRLRMIRLDFRAPGIARVERNALGLDSVEGIKLKQGLTQKRY